MEQEQSKERKRRVHYAGKYPKKFEEKYKEHNPEKYADTVAHVIEKGSTPAGMHISIMVQEILDFLQIQPGQQGLDATLGYGGHTSRMLEQLKGKGHITALDVDPIESAKRNCRRGFWPAEEGCGGGHHYSTAGMYRKGTCFFARRGAENHLQEVLSAGVPGAAY